MTMISLMQGAVAGGTTSYLRNRVKQEASEKKVDTWVTTALQANHVMLLSAETACAAGFALGSFGLITQIAYVLTPVTFALPLLVKNVKPLSPERADQLNQVYRAAVVVNSVASLALGNPVFAGASLAMLAIDVLVKGDAKEVFACVNKVAAALAFAGYGAQVFMADSLMAVLGKVSTAISAFKFFLLDNRSDSPVGLGVSSSPSDSYPESTVQHVVHHRGFGYSDSYNNRGVIPQPSSSLNSVKVTGQGNWFTRSGAWS